ncbi:hypothetical protein ACGF0D_12435 [Kitasatospora sp. NPDC048298]|uniref:hypothetical protein n=1 Tax=Kitasatospora sp. NPDC048298 TaxID=3364049 RepID=UPI003722223F
MLGIHHQAAHSTSTAKTDELGRVGWVVLGSSLFVAGAVAHALSGLIAIAKEILRPAPQRAPAPVRPVRPGDLSVAEKDGWILISVLLIATGAVAHAVSHVIGTIKEVTHATHRQVRV